jgi:hypothetical protein
VACPARGLALKAARESRGPPVERPRRPRNDFREGGISGSMNNIADTKRLANAIDSLAVTMMGIMADRPSPNR